VMIAFGPDSRPEQPATRPAVHQATSYSPPGVKAMSEATTLWTIGHSTRAWEEFVALLREFGVETVCGIRAFPSSRKFPQFNGATMRDGAVIYPGEEELLS